MAVDLSKADSELCFQMEEVGVSAAVQKKIYDAGVTSLRIFGGLEESREEMRAVFLRPILALTQWATLRCARRSLSCYACGRARVCS